MAIKGPNKIHKLINTDEINTTSIIKSRITKYFAYETLPSPNTVVKQVVTPLRERIESDQAYDILTELIDTDNNLIAKQLLQILCKSGHSTSEPQLLAIFLNMRMLASLAKMPAKRYETAYDIAFAWIQSLDVSHCDLFCTLLWPLNKSKQLTPDDIFQNLSLMKKHTNRRYALSSLVNAFIMYIIRLRCEIMAASFCLQFVGTNVVFASTLEECAQALLVLDPDQTPYRIHALKSLCDTFGLRIDLDPKMSRQLVNMGISYDFRQYPGFANDCYDLAKKYSVGHFPTNTLYRLLLLNIKHQNLSKALEIWDTLMSQNQLLEEHDKLAIAALLYRLSKEAKYISFAKRLAYSLDKRYYHLEGIAEALFTVCSRLRDGKLFSSVMSAQRTPLRRSLLFPVLKYYLQTSNNGGSSKVNDILDQILNSESGMSADELSELVRYYCRMEAGPVKAREFLRQMAPNWDRERLEKSYAALANGVIEARQVNNKDYDRYFDESIAILDRSRSQEIWDIAANLKLKRHVVAQDLAGARQVWQDLMLRDQDNKTPMYSTKSRKIGLTTILDGALRLQKTGQVDLSYVSWLVAECDELGMSHKEIGSLIRNRSGFKKLPTEIRKEWNQRIDQHFDRSQPIVYM